MKEIIDIATYWKHFLTIIHTLIKLSYSRDSILTRVQIRVAYFIFENLMEFQF